MKLIEKLSAVKSKACASFLALAMAVLVPSVAFADLATVIEPKITSLVTEVTSVAGVVVLVVLAVIGAKVVFSLLKKA